VTFFDRVLGSVAQALQACGIAYTVEIASIGHREAWLRFFLFTSLSVSVPAAVEVKLLLHIDPMF
jgi:hypothetical protein